MFDDEPNFDFDVIPAEEHDLAWIVQGSLSSLGSYVRKFEQALSLFEFAEHQHRLRLSDVSPEGIKAMSALSGWKFVAARDGAMTIYHFMCAMESVKTCVYRSPTLKPWFNAKVSKQATKLFGVRFPKCEAMRHAIAHSAELYESPEKLEENAFSGDYKDKMFDLQGVKGVVIADTLSNRSYITTFKRQIISYDVSMDTLNALTEIRKLFCSAFMRPASSDLPTDDRVGGD